MVTPDELGNRFRYHPATTKARQDAHEGIRRMLGHVAAELNDHLPESREKGLALTSVEEAMFWANAAVARQ